VATNLLGTVVKVVPDSLDDFGEGAFILGVDGRQAHGGAILAADDAPQASLTLDNAVRNVHFPAKRWQMHYELDGIYVVSNDDQLSHLFLHESSHRVESQP